MAAMIAVSVAVLGVGFRLVASAVDARRFPPPGEMVDVGGHRLHLDCRGDGSPTVVLEAGAQAFSTSWAWIQSELADVTRVCAYDRAGLGWSEPGPAPRDARQVTRELDALLNSAGVEAPYVLVGHSLGGLFVRRFAHDHREDVAAVVLVDARHPDYMTRSPAAEAEIRGAVPMVRIGGLLSELGVTRVLGDVFGMTDGLPPDAARATAVRFSTPGSWWATLEEVRAFPATERQVRDAGPLGDLPLLVLSRDGMHAAETDASERAWQEMQRDQATLSTRSRHHVVSGSDHVGLLTDASHARSVAEGIRDLVTEYRERFPR